MYYLKIYKDGGEHKGIRIPISKETFETLLFCRWTWWTEGLSNDLNNRKLMDGIDNRFTDIFYRIMNQIIEDKLGMTAERDFEYDEFNDNEDEILVYITLK